MQLFVSKHNILAPIGMDAQWLSEQVELPFLINALPAHTLYLMLQTRELNENLEFIEWIRGPQLQKILDFDIWEYNSSFETEDVSHDTAMSWIQAWLVFGKPFTAERFFELEEEVIILILTKFFEILAEGVSHITDDIRENWMLTPDKRFFIKPLSSDGTDFEILTEFIHALYNVDMPRAGFLFSAASLLIRQDALEIAQKWRQSRLSEQGFIQNSEAISTLFSRHSLPRALSGFQYPSKVVCFSEHATENITNFISSIEPEDGVHLIKQTLGKEGIKQLTGSHGIVNIAHLYDDTEFMNDCIDHIVQLSENIYNKLESAHSFESKNSDLLIEKTLKNFSKINDKTFLILKQKIAYISNNVASALFSHKAYDHNALNTALIIVRGCLNIGLEFCLENGDLYHLRFESEDEVSNSTNCIETLGIEYIFKLGFNVIVDLQKILLNFLVENKNISIKKVATAMNWLNSDQFSYSNEIRLSFEGLLHLIPMCHTELFATDNTFKDTPIYLSQQFKPFEHKSEVIFVQKMLQNIQHNLH